MLPTIIVYGIACHIAKMWSSALDEKRNAQTSAGAESQDSVEGEKDSAEGGQDNAKDKQYSTEDE